MIETKTEPRFIASERDGGWGIEDRESGAFIHCADRGLAVELAGVLEGMKRIWVTNEEPSEPEPVIGAKCSNASLVTARRIVAAWEEDQLEDTLVETFAEALDRAFERAILVRAKPRLAAVDASE